MMDLHFLCSFRISLINDFDFFGNAFMIGTENLDENPNFSGLRRDFQIMSQIFIHKHFQLLHTIFVCLMMV